jgi:enoyl-CoA hydratase
MAEFIRIETPSPDIVEGIDGADKVAIIRLERPKVNALNTQLCQELLDAATEIAGRSDIRGVVLWGGPKIFAAGADIADFPIGEPDREVDVDTLNNALVAIESLPQISVSAVNGVALGGGCELTLTTDFRVCGQSAAFGLPEILLGIFPGGGGTKRLTQLVGMTRAKDLIYTGRNVDAAEAEAIGLVSAVHPDDEVLAQAVAFVARFANGPAGLAYAKRAIQDGYNLSIDEALEIEAREFKAVFHTEDAATGIRSFLDHGPGKATFNGK